MDSSILEREWLQADARLTEAEWEVVDGVARGWNHARIGEWLGIQPATVGRHIGNITSKLPPHCGLRGYSRILYWLVKHPNAIRPAA